jgi:hypothetical protein
MTLPLCGESQSDVQILYSKNRVKKRVNMTRKRILTLFIISVRFAIKDSPAGERAGGQRKDAHCRSIDPSMWAMNYCQERSRLCFPSTAPAELPLWVGDHQ